MIWTLQDVLDASHHLATKDLDPDERAHLKEIVELTPELVAVAANHVRQAKVKMDAKPWEY